MTTNATVTTGTILDRIVAAKRDELVRRRAEEPQSVLAEKAQRFRDGVEFAAALRGPRLRLIAEIKKASPSKGVLEPELDPLARARAYAAGGASAISVLTEVPNFMGSLGNLESVRTGLASDLAGSRPALLRKDFLFDPYHLYEAKAYGADAALLIVAILPQTLLCELLELAVALDLGTLVEVHDEQEVERALHAGARVIGVNNRDLRTFATTLEVTVRLRPLIPPDRVMVSESGLNGAADAARLRALGVDAVLVGEALMTSRNLTDKLKEFMPV